MKKKQDNATKWTIGIVIVIVLCFVGFFVYSKMSQNNEAAADQIDYKNQPFEGDKSAPVKIVEFGDYKCPICKNFNESFVPQIKKDFVDTGKAKFYFMNYAFINVDSTRAALFAETVYNELGDDTFWKFHEALYSKTREEDEKKDVFTEKTLANLLKPFASEKEVQKVVKTYQSNKAKAALDKDESYVTKLGITGTPTVFINGKKFTGQTYEDFAKQVKKAEKE
ncbi:thioredoxin domain-containing protein [Fictibacillus sp. Mic-4]|uniref:DsbA family protein n=1 Tax=Fictibacillus TaxID=1329200 RepID=UPI000428AB5A|nr:thioredoxin domain-containing protein [Fictibacillus gelatini]